MMILLFDVIMFKNSVVMRGRLFFNFKFMVLLAHVLVLCTTSGWLVFKNTCSTTVTPLKQLSEKCETSKKQLYDILYKNSPFDSFLEYK